MVAWQVVNNRRAAAGEDGQRCQEPLEHQTQAPPARQRPAPEGRRASPPHGLAVAELLHYLGAREDAAWPASAPAP
jgi:hypothetical protein